MPHSPGLLCLQGSSGTAVHLPGQPSLRRPCADGWRCTGEGGREKGGRVEGGEGWGWGKGGWGKGGGGGEKGGGGGEKGGGGGRGVIHRQDGDIYTVLSVGHYYPVV